MKRRILKNWLEAILITFMLACVMFIGSEPVGNVVFTTGQFIAFIIMVICGYLVLRSVREME